MFILDYHSGYRSVLLWTLQCVDFISRGFWCILHVINFFFCFVCFSSCLTQCLSTANFYQNKAKQYHWVSVHVRIFFSNMHVIINHGRAKKTVATSWNNRMSENTFSGMYVLLVKQASLTTLHPSTYGCKWVYEPHMYFILHHCKWWTYCFNYIYVENKIGGLKQAMPPVCESWIVLIKNST